MLQRDVIVRQEKTNQIFLQLVHSYHLSTPFVNIYVYPLSEEYMEPLRYPKVFEMFIIICLLCTM